MIHFGVVVVSDICIFCALCEEVQLRLRHSQHAVRAESVLTREPGLSAPARLYGQTVFTGMYIINVFLSFTSLTVLR